ncbi:fiber 2 [Duck adenovirus 3]|uniref:Fiber 2 n=1 Tax=Duck adenovirus 3 TaxID=2233538 RepID=A0A7G5BBV6_9ADEN|nr:fiber 2 [Duck adenovirus 3]USH59597.1 fiber 2 [Duck adenovirus 3]
MKRTNRSDNGEGFTKRAKIQASASATIDLTYPFWEQASSANPINPPFVTGPLYDDNGYLNVRTSDPIRTVGNSLSLLYDDSLAVTSGKLGVKIDPNGPLDESPAGLSLALGDGLEEDEFTGLSVKPDPRGPIEVSDEGVGIAYDTETMSITSMQQNSQMTLGVRLNPDGALHSNNGLDVKIDDDALIVSDEGLTVLVSESGPLTIDPGKGLDIDIDQSLSVRTNPQGEKELGINIIPTSCITLDNGGLDLKVDPGSLAVTDNTLHLTSSYSTYVFTSGSDTLQKTQAQVCCGAGSVTFPCAYYAKIVCSNNVSSGYITLKVSAEDASHAVDQRFATIQPVFTFWLCRDIGNENTVNFSHCTNNSYKPEETAVVKACITPAYKNFDVSNVSEHDFILYNYSGVNTSGVPIGTGNLKNVYDYVSRFSIAQVSGSPTSPQLTFTIELNKIDQSSYYLYKQGTTGDITIGPIPFSYVSNPSNVN